MRTLSPRVLPLLAAVSLAGCGPKISAFTVQPLVLCGPDAVRVDWEVRGDPRLEVRVDPATGEEEAGALPEPPADTLTFLLVVEKGGKEATRQVAVLQQPARFERDVVFRTAWAPDSTLVARGTVDEKWAPFAIESVASASGREIVAEHDGVTVTLPADSTPSATLAGRSLAGEWVLRTVASPPLPDRLRVRATVGCTREEG